MPKGVTGCQTAGIDLLERHYMQVTDHVEGYKQKYNSPQAQRECA